MSSFGNDGAPKGGTRYAPQASLRFSRRYDAPFGQPSPLNLACRSILWYRLYLRLISSPDGLCCTHIVPDEMKKLQLVNLGDTAMKFHEISGRNLCGNFFLFVMMCAVSLS